VPLPRAADAPAPHALTPTRSWREREEEGENRPLADVRARIGTFPLERAREACGKIRSGEAKFRMVLTMDKA
jgi:hypothetical protein